MQIIKYGKYFITLSLALLIPGIISLLIFGLNLSIDFTGGSVFVYTVESSADTQITKFRETLGKQEGVQIKEFSLDDGTLTLKTNPLESKASDQVSKAIETTFAKTQQVSVETVGPTVGTETTKNAFLAVLVASFAIVAYIAYSFRNIPQPYSSVRFGASAIIAMLHDALMIIGIFSILGHFYGTEINALFITAVLTVIGFSVHDTIVVFDRIRENLSKLPKSFKFAEIVDYSITETLGRSMATSLTVIITLFSMYMLGGESIRDFVFALLIGIVSGTYSSIFTAAPILVYWEQYISTKKSKKK